MSSVSENAVKAGLTRNRAKRPTRYRDAFDFLAMTRRIIRAAGVRVGEADTDELRALIALRTDLDAAIVTAVSGLRASGTTWAEIGDLTGVSRQAALQYFAPRLEKEVTDSRN